VSTLVILAVVGVGNYKFAVLFGRILRILCFVCTDESNLSPEVNDNGKVLMHSVQFIGVVI